MAVSWIAFHLTDRCQLDCQHCLRDPARKPADLDLALVERVLDQAVALYGVHEVALTGGEPTLHPQLFDIVDAIVARGLRWHMVSNGHRFDRLLATLQAVPARMAGLSAIDFSLDGADEATHDSIRGAGSFRTVMAAVAMARAHGVPVVLQCTLHRRNLDQIEALSLMGAKLGAGRVSFDLMQPTGTLHDVGFRLSSRDARLARDRILQMDAALSIDVTPSTAFPSDAALVMCDSFNSEVLHVDAHGFLNLCCRHSGIPSEGPPADRIADLNTTPLVDAHRAMMRMVAGAIDDRLAAIAEQRVGGWDASACNFCLRCFGKPHWTDEGIGGPKAQRERWRGAWAKPA